MVCYRQRGIFGPYFFEDNDGNRVTVNTKQYIEIKAKKVCSCIAKEKKHWYGHGVPPHCLNRTLKFLRQYSPWERLISRRTNNPWPPYSPDLNPQTIFCEGTWKTEFMKTIRRQQRFSKTTSEEKSDGLHKKCSIELWTILMFEFLQS